MFDGRYVGRNVLITITKESKMRAIGDVTEGRINTLVVNEEGREFIGIESEGYQLFASCDTGEVFVIDHHNPGELMSVAEVVLKEDLEQ